MELLQFLAPPAVAHHSFGSPVLEPHTGHQQVVWANYLFYCSKLVGCLEIYLNLSSSLSLKVSESENTFSDSCDQIDQTLLYQL